MPVTIKLADDVRRLGRDGMTVDEIAVTLDRPAADILATLTMLGLPLPGERTEREPAALSDEERATLRAKMRRSGRTEADSKRTIHESRT